MFPKPSHNYNIHLKPTISKQLLLTAPSSDLKPYMGSSSSFVELDDAFSLPIVGRSWTSSSSSSSSSSDSSSPSPFKFYNPFSTIAASIFRSFLPALQSLLIPSCQLLSVMPNTSPRTGRANARKRLTGTFFGQKKGRVSFAVQETPRSEPMLVLELAMQTSQLVKEMASGMVRILLECEKIHTNTIKKGRVGLWDEPVWTMYCNGHKMGYAVSRSIAATDFHVLSMVQTMSVGAGVLPPAALLPPLMLPPPPPEAAQPIKNGGGGGGDIMYMRAKFDRVIGGKDSEAFYMINPDCSGRNTGNTGSSSKFNSGGPELSFFMLRL